MKREIAEEEAEPRRRTSTLTQRLAHTRGGEGDGSGSGRSKRSGGNGGAGGAGGAGGGAGGRAGGGAGRGGRSSGQPQGGAGGGRCPHRRRPRPPGSIRRRWTSLLAGEGFEHAPDEAEDEGISRGQKLRWLGQAAPGRNRAPPRETPLMGMLAWVMMGLAIWHFTIWLPRDRFYGGIVGAFTGRPHRLRAVRVHRQRLLHSGPPRDHPGDIIGGDSRRGAIGIGPRSTPRACGASVPAARSPAREPLRSDMRRGPLITLLTMAAAALYCPGGRTGELPAATPSVSREDRRRRLVVAPGAVDHAQRFGRLQPAGHRLRVPRALHGCRRAAGEIPAARARPGRQQRARTWSWGCSPAARTAASSTRCSRLTRPRSPTSGPSTTSSMPAPP